ncbi:MAG: nucleoside deaminase [Prevotella sp.]|nr:nucleoside deaminase [Prevotella sp.]
MNKTELMQRAIALSEESVRKGGGPFGAVIARGGDIVAEASNSVTLDNDPTAHAEVNAIRKAARQLGTFNLQGCDIYCSCEPCPMCFGAIYWARLDRIFYANTRTDAARIGFDDDFIYREIALPVDEREKTMERLLPDEARRAFEMWEQEAGKTRY